MTEGEIAAFHDSFQRCMETGLRFVDVFYDHFLKSSPEITAKFRGTDFRRQKHKLQLSLHMMVGALVLHSPDYSMLAYVAEHHARTNWDIPPHLYPLWLDSLIFAVKTCDPSFDGETEKNWRTAMQPGIDYIVSLY
jgi:hemoglobin-like flavoprotein